MRNARLSGIALGVFVLATFGAAGAAPAWKTPTSRSVDCNDGTVTYSPTKVWPPNHKMIDVTINYDEGEDDGDTITITVGTISHSQADSDGQNELPGSGKPVSEQGLDWGGTGNTDSAVDSEDSTGSDAPPATTKAQIRSERSGTSKAGRSYTINVTCTDMNNESGEDPQSETVALAVCVPHDQGKSSDCV